MDQARYELVAVAFVRSTGGRVRVLLAIDREGEQLFDGEPALLVEHRPGGTASDVVVEGADRIPVAALEHVHACACGDVARLVEAAFDEVGSFDGERLLGRSIVLEGGPDLFDA